MRLFRSALSLMTCAALMVWGTNALAHEPTGETFHVKLTKGDTVLQDEDITLMPGGDYEASKFNLTLFFSGSPGQGPSTTLPLLTALKWRDGDRVDLYADVPSVSLVKLAPSGGGEGFQVPSHTSSTSTRAVLIPRGSNQVVTLSEEGSKDADRQAIVLSLTRVGPKA